MSLTANVRGGSVEAVARQVTAHSDVAGMRGPTIAKVYPKTPADGDEEWFAVTVIVARDHLQDAVDALRQSGASDMTARQLAYVFEQKAWSYEALLRAIGTTRSENGRSS